MSTNNEVSKDDSVFYSLSFSGFKVVSYNRIVPSDVEISKGGTRMEVEDSHEGCRVLLEDWDNSESIDKATITLYREGLSSILQSEEAEHRFGPVFRDIQDYLLENLLVCFQGTAQDKIFKAHHYFLPYKNYCFYLC
jgi:hypothetical protein